MGRPARIHTNVKFVGHSVDSLAVKLRRCPYDSTTLDVDAYSGGSYLLTCTACGAKWDAHNSLVRRTAEPDWELVTAARARSDADSLESAAP